MIKNKKDYRPWYQKGKVIELAQIANSSGLHYRHPVRPYTGSMSDELLISDLMHQGYVVVIVDYGVLYDIPSVYNDVNEVGEQLELLFDELQ